jgi:hypothetical protein
VDEVELDAGYIGLELREGVDARLVRAPLETLFPVRDQAAQV